MDKEIEEQEQKEQIQEELEKVDQEEQVNQENKIEQEAQNEYEKEVEEKQKEGDEENQEDQQKEENENAGENEEEEQQQQQDIQNEQNENQEEMQEEIQIDSDEQQQDEKDEFADIINECNDNIKKLEQIYIQKEHQYQQLSIELNQIQEEIWNHVKEEYEQNQIKTDIQIKKEIEELQRKLNEKEERIEILEKEIKDKNAEGELVKMRSKYKETQQHKEISIRRQYKNAMSGETEIYAALRVQAEELKHEVDFKKNLRDKLEEELRKSEEAIKELRRLKREGASKEHELQELIENYKQK